MLESLTSHCLHPALVAGRNSHSESLLFFFLSFFFLPDLNLGPSSPGIYVASVWRMSYLVPNTSIIIGWENENLRGSVWSDGEGISLEADSVNIHSLINWYVLQISSALTLSPALASLNFNQYKLNRHIPVSLDLSKSPCMRMVLYNKW